MERRGYCSAFKYPQPSQEDKNEKHELLDGVLNSLSAAWEFSKKGKVYLGHSGQKRP